MTTTTARDFAADIDALRKENEDLRALIQPKKHRELWRRPIALVGVAVLTVAALAGVAGASGSTTNVAFTALTPTKAILTNAAIGAKKTSSPVVIGGTTTVPSNATTVELSVTAKGAAVGVLDFYPSGNPTGGSGDTLYYPGSNTSAVTTIHENVGQGGALTIYNNGTGTATVTAKIIGYSTQVTAGDISGRDGAAGQVLTNDGTGGASWQTPLGAFSSHADNVAVQHLRYTDIDTLTLAAGSYDVTATFSATSSTPDLLECGITSPFGVTPLTDWDVSTAMGSTYYGGGTVQALVSTTGGPVTFRCKDQLNAAGSTIQSEEIIASQVGSASGTVIH
jgi:hypothetical protein